MMLYTLYYVVILYAGDTVSSYNTSAISYSTLTQCQKAEKSFHKLFNDPKHQMVIRSTCISNNLT